tara:strand:+ start:200 stop:619 length:420 start_codon:yes stop_codon:yes gene_type:complete
MALIPELGKIKNHEELCFFTDEVGNELVNPVTDTLIWCTLFVGMGEITKKNAPQFYARVRFMEVMQEGPFLHDRGSDTLRIPRPITLADVEAHIGLNTNVYDRETDYRWAAKKGKEFLEKEIKRANWEREKREEQQPVA